MKRCNTNSGFQAVCNAVDLFAAILALGLFFAVLIGACDFLLESLTPPESIQIAELSK